MDQKGVAPEVVQGARAGVVTGRCDQRRPLVPTPFGAQMGKKTTSPLSFLDRGRKGRFLTQGLWVSRATPE